MGDSEYEVIMDGGGPWGIRLHGGKDFGVALNVARVTPGSKASLKGILPSDQILSINGNVTENLTHMDAQNLIKNAGDRLQLRLKQGAGGSQGDVRVVGSGAFAAQPKMTLYQTDVTHSAGVDHKYNAKPKSFISSTGSSTGGVSHVSVPVTKFDPKEYARRKKEELEKYKEEKSADQIVVDSDVLKMLQKTSVQDTNTNTTGLQKPEEEADVPDAPPLPPEKPVFGMAAPNPYNLPIKAVVSNEGGNPILDALKGKMKEMNIDADRIDRSSSVSSDDRGKYLSQTSRDAAARPITPTSPVVESPIGAPKSPSMFRQSIKGGGNPTGVQGANELMSSLKNRVKGDRMTLGLKQTRGLGASQRKLEENQCFNARALYSTRLSSLKKPAPLNIGSGSKPTSSEDSFMNGNGHISSTNSNNSTQSDNNPTSVKNATSSIRRYTSPSKITRISAKSINTKVDHNANTLNPDDIGEEL